MSAAGVNTCVIAILLDDCARQSRDEGTFSLDAICDAFEADPIVALREHSPFAFRSPTQTRRDRPTRFVRQAGSGAR